MGTVRRGREVELGRPGLALAPRPPARLPRRAAVVAAAPPGPRRRGGGGLVGRARPRGPAVLPQEPVLARRRDTPGRGAAEGRPARTAERGRSCIAVGGWTHQGARAVAKRRGGWMRPSAKVEEMGGRFVGSWMTLLRGRAGPTSPPPARRRRPLSSTSRHRGGWTARGAGTCTSGTPVRSAARRGGATPQGQRAWTAAGCGHAIARTEVVPEAATRTATFGSCSRITASAASCAALACSRVSQNRTEAPRVGSSSERSQ